MSGGNFRGPLPGHLRTGRGNTGGPVIGGPLVFCGHVESFATVAETIVCSWVMPMAVRLHAFCHYIRDVGLSTHSLNLYKNDANSLTGATSLLTGAASHTGNNSGKLITLAEEDTVSSNIMLTRATRDIARDQWVIVTAAQAAATALDLSFSITVFSTNFADTSTQEND